MRIVKEISGKSSKITIYAWNNRYLFKLEQGPLEQTFKIDMSEVREQDLDRIIDAQFLEEASRRFAEMGDSFAAAFQRSED